MIKWIYEYSGGIPMSRIMNLLNGQGGNYILPFFWQHGEDEEVLRKYMHVIHDCGIGAVCVESRPHPDFAGEKWWRDLDAILEEAEKLGMKVWILDDSHFPTGFANGALTDKPDELHRQSITFQRFEASKEAPLVLKREQLAEAAPWQPKGIEAMVAQVTGKPAYQGKIWKDDELLGVFAVRVDGGRLPFSVGNDPVDLTGKANAKGEIVFTPEEGVWRVYVMHKTRNRGPHREYINMMDKESVRVLIDAVYEPHYKHYASYFGNVIAGFFSDEPELGNGHLYEHTENGLGCFDEEDWPWSRELEERLKEALGSRYPASLALLWDNEGDPDVTAEIRYRFMDHVTRLVEKDFSYQLGDWCREHGVEYIGHLIEDSNAHSHTGSSLGHYFRGLAGEDMAGIDDIGGQVFPGGEEVNGVFGISYRDGEFYHYMLGKLASSAAALEPLKKGNSMCEIFGNYGWEEGVRLEKYLADHFLVRGVNHFVPHAFTPKEFPDPDCPPHFYAHGHNPQYRHFGSLMRYMNRAAELITDGRHIAPVAVLYHGESEWMGKWTPSHKAGHVLSDAQIEYDYLPSDVFGDREHYHTVIEEGVLKAGTQEYKILLIPECDYITEAAANGITELLDAGVRVAFVDRKALNAGDTESSYEDVIGRCDVVALDDLVSYVEKYDGRDVTFEPGNDRMRYYHYLHEDGTHVYMFVNEGTSVYEGIVTIGQDERGVFYDAYHNRVYRPCQEDQSIQLRVEPLKSVFLVIAGNMEERYQLLKKAEELPDVTHEGENVLAMEFPWQRSLCRAIEYPSFGEAKDVTIPDHVEKEEPLFSGYVRYTNRFIKPKAEKVTLEISDAGEAVEVFVNGNSLGIEIVPPMRYDLTPYLESGYNRVTIEVATTLEREMSTVPDPYGRPKKISENNVSGLNGKVTVYYK